MLMDVMLRRIFISICFVFQELYRILKIRRRHFIWLLGEWGKEDWGWIVGSSSCMLVPDGLGLGGEQFNSTSIWYSSDGNYAGCVAAVLWSTSSLLHMIVINEGERTGASVWPSIIGNLNGWWQPSVYEHRAPFIFNWRKACHVSF